MKKIILCTSGSGALFDICFKFPFFKNIVAAIISDRDCDALKIAKKHGIPHRVIKEADDFQFNQQLLKLSQEFNIDYVISYSFLRLFRKNFLAHYPFEVFNSHFSLLPAFKGYYDKRDKKRTYPARSIFERTLEQGSIVTGNTIHRVNELVDDGEPLMVSLLPIDQSSMSEKEIRHLLFIQECKSILQFCKWLGEGKVLKEHDQIKIKDSSYKLEEFIPNLDDTTISNLDF